MTTEEKIENKNTIHEESKTSESIASEEEIDKAFKNYWKAYFLFFFK